MYISFFWICTLEWSLEIFILLLDEACYVKSQVVKNFGLAALIKATEPFEFWSSRRVLNIFWRKKTFMQLPPKKQTNASADMHSKKNIYSEISISYLQFLYPYNANAKI